MFKMQNLQKAVGMPCCVGLGGLESSDRRMWLGEVVSRVRGANYNLANVLCDPAD